MCVVCACVFVCVCVFVFTVSVACRSVFVCVFVGYVCCLCVCVCVCVCVCLFSPSQWPAGLCVCVCVCVCIYLYKRSPLSTALSHDESLCKRKQKICWGLVLGDSNGKEMERQWREMLFAAWLDLKYLHKPCNYKLYTWHCQPQ